MPSLHSLPGVERETGQHSTATERTPGEADGEHPMSTRSMANAPSFFMSLHGLEKFTYLPPVSLRPHPTCP